MNSSIIKWRESIQLILFALFSLVLAWYFNGGFNLDFNIPLIYGGDGIFTSWIIKRTMEGVWYFSNSANGFPFGSDFYDYPAPDTGSFLLFKLIGYFAGNYARTLNGYYLLGFPVVSLVSFFVFRKFGVSKTFSFVGALIFTFSPFHFVRLPHLLYTWYFAAPLFAWFSLRIFVKEPLFFVKTTNWKSSLRDILLLLILSSFGVYYAFFGMLMMIFSGVLSTIQQKSRKHILSAAIACLIVSIGIFANLAPTLIYRVEHGTNQEVAQRSALESEAYGLKIAQLVVPRPDHRMLHFHSYERAKFLILNNLDPLGLVTSIGLLALIVLLFIQKDKDPRLHWLSALVVFMLLFATIDGFSVLFAILITPMIRAWDRMSIFIGFIAILGLMIMLDGYFKRLNPTRFLLKLKLPLAVGLLCIALWDQTVPANLAGLQANKQMFINDRDFVQQIERSVPAGTAIYQLPYMPFPEVPPVNKLGDYELFRGYLHSSKLNWSYGGMKGRAGDLFYRALSKQPMIEQIKVVEKMGFSAVYIDRRGYADNGAAVEAELTKITGKAPAIVSTDKQLSFFRLSP